MNSIQLPKITVITVAYNAGHLLEETIKSVAMQTYKNIEYMIIDGGSNDGSMELVKKYESYVAKFISEKDDGIYDAMNKGISLAAGEWINFLNAGDRYISETTLCDIFQNLSIGDDVDILAGSTVVDFGDYRVFRKAHSPDQLWRGTQFCHQSSFIRTKLHKSLNYNTNNKIVADFEFFYNCFKADKKFKVIDLPISIYKAGGISDKRKYQVQKGFFITVFSKEANLKIVSFYLFRLGSLFIKDIIKFFIGKKSLRKIRERNSKN